MRHLAVVILLCAGLAACGEEKDGTTITINASGSDGNVTGGVDGKTGEIALNVPGFSGSVRLPKIKLDAENFKLNGVSLYPGSTIKTMNIVARDEKDGADDKSHVRVVFESPADPATVRDWFAAKLGQADFKLHADGLNLVGSDEDGKPFRLDLAPAAGGHAAGTIVAAG